MTSYQRKALIENRVPFIVPDSQVFLPFMGTFLRERMKSVEKQTERMISDDPGRLYKSAKPILINPVIKRVVVKNDAQVILLPLAGESALSAQSMLNPPGMQCRAVSRHMYKTMGNLMVVNPDWDRVNDCCELEVWKYDPNVLCQNGMVDPLSLVLSLKDAEDERVEIAVMEFVEGLQW